MYLAIFRIAPQQNKHKKFLPVRPLPPQPINESRNTCFSTTRLKISASQAEISSFQNSTTKTAPNSSPKIRAASRGWPVVRDLCRKKSTSFCSSMASSLRLVDAFLCRKTSGNLVVVILVDPLIVVQSHLCICRFFLLILFLSVLCPCLTGFYIFSRPVLRSLQTV